MLNKKFEITFDEAIIIAEKYLTQKNIESAKLNAELLLLYACKISSIDLRLKKNEIVPKENLDLFYDLIAQRATRKPLQYILGYVDFYDVRLKINESVLIPRPETEQLIDIIKNENTTSNFSHPICYSRHCEDLSEAIYSIENRLPRYARNDGYKINSINNILDICSGSGCISFALSKLYPNSKIDAIDISKDAIDLAIENSKFLNISNVNFIHCDLKKYNFENKKYDLIVCNPPYIATSEYSELAPELFFEPKIALTDNDDGLSFYRFLSERIDKTVGDISESATFIKLDKNGKVFFECGHCQAEIICNIFNEKNYRTKIFKDFANIERFVMVW